MIPEMVKDYARQRGLSEQDALQTLEGGYVALDRPSGSGIECQASHRFTAL